MKKYFAVMLLLLTHLGQAQNNTCRPADTVTIRRLQKLTGTQKTLETDLAVLKDQQGGFENYFKGSLTPVTL